MIIIVLSLFKQTFEVHFFSQSRSNIMNINFAKRSKRVKRRCKKLKLVLLVRMNSVVVINVLVFYMNVT